MVETLQDSEEGPELNPVALAIFQRGLKNVEPLIPPEFEGLILPIVDMSEVFEVYFNLLEETLVEDAESAAKKAEHRRSIAKLRADMRKRLAPLDGGLVELSNITEADT